MSNLLHQLVITRHSESEWNRLDLFTGWYDIGLSSAGQKEAVQIGNRLKKEAFDFDICFTSYLKRAITTQYIALNQMDRLWLPVVKAWELNERHYGQLQSMNKMEAAGIYGGEQIHKWRRSYTAHPPALNTNDDQNPRFATQYREVPDEFLPLTESLEDTYTRVVGYYQKNIEPQIRKGKRVFLVSHGNSLRVLTKYLEDLSVEKTTQIYIPTGIPIVYDFDHDLRIVSKRMLADEKLIATKMAQEKEFSQQLYIKK